MCVWGDYLRYVFEYRSDNRKQTDIELLPKDFVLERSEEKSIPYGDDRWVVKTVKKYDIEQVLREVCRSRSGG